MSLLLLTFSGGSSLQLHRLERHRRESRDVERDFVPPRRPSSTSRSSGSISCSANTIRGSGAVTARQACEIERSHVSDHPQV